MLTNNDGQLDPAAKVHQKYPIQLQSLVEDTIMSTENSPE